MAWSLDKTRQYNRDYQRGWRKANPDKVKEIKRKFNQKNKLKYNVTERAWRARNKDKVKAYMRRRSLQRYGLTETEFQCLYEYQKGRCAICTRGLSGFKKRPSVDHNHQTGTVRSLLCGPCNTALGLFQEDILRMRAAIEYLEKHNETVERS